MKTFRTNPDVHCFETGGPNGLITIVAGEPYTTESQTEISILEEAGAHALTVAEGAPKAVADKGEKRQERAEPVTEVEPKDDDSKAGEQS